MCNNTPLFNALGWQYRAERHPLKGNNKHLQLLNLQAPASLKTAKYPSFFTSLGWTTLTLDFLLKIRFIPSLGWTTLTLDFLLKRLFTPSSTSNDFNNTATIWTPIAVKRRVF